MLDLINGLYNLLYRRTVGLVMWAPLPNLLPCVYVTCVLHPQEMKFINLLGSTVDPQYVCDYLRTGSEQCAMRAIDAWGPMSPDHKLQKLQGLIESNSPAAGTVGFADINWHWPQKMWADAKARVRVEFYLLRWTLALCFVWGLVPFLLPNLSVVWMSFLLGTEE
jgi:hypothetical protein